MIKEWGLGISQQEHNKTETESPLGQKLDSAVESKECYGRFCNRRLAEMLSLSIGPDGALLLQKELSQQSQQIDGVLEEKLTNVATSLANVAQTMAIGGGHQQSQQQSRSPSAAKPPKGRA